MRILRLCLVGAAVLLLAGAARTLAGRAGRDGFDHWQHRRLFPTCEGCHGGMVDSTRSVWPAAADCAACHDGTIERRVEWSPPAGTRPSNLRFDHRRHAKRAAGRLPADSVTCAACHLAPGAPWMQVRRAAAGQCFDCHGIRTEHLAAPDTACATCHLTLAQATALPVERIARFPATPSHQAPDFARHHQVSATCATCHARDFCVTCHVNAPEVRAIQALAPDARSLAIQSKLEPPPDHAQADFIQHHGRDARRAPTRCATCHTQESCVTCHTAQPNVAVALHSAGPGRGPGAKVTRARPPSHGDDFTTRHAQLAASAPRSCTACHARADCLDCHRPDAGSTAGFHPVGFLSRHPAAAYARETSCAECHNQGQFCADCHAQAGLRARGTLRGGFHDAKPSFLFAHGPAARQSLESCVSCHAERDCLTCHSDINGRGFNPHGPDFDADRMRRHNSQMCTVCHGAGIPPTSH
ncbi:MAG TPA: hypothetical protein VFN08_18345 [Gemmatimonadales bacterium]|jgi:hypothetical protein|nr:hypothetical protein [Gemmatimonadales bacterium]